LTLRRAGCAPTQISPEVGFSCPAIKLRSVDFPDPFFPMIPMDCPRSTTKLNGCKASISNPRRARDRPTSEPSFDTKYFFDTSRTMTEGLFDSCITMLRSPEEDYPNYKCSDRPQGKCTPSLPTWHGAVQN